MESNCLTNVWSPKRLIQMLNITHKRNVETWKQLPVLSSSQDKDVNCEDRDAIVMWIAKVNIKFNFQHETFFLATSILDRFISSVKAQPKYLKCIAISCLYLASKVTEEEDVIPCTGELVAESECGCRVCDVLRMERIILEKLSWNIDSSTALDYLHLFLLLAFDHFTDIGSTLSLPKYITKLGRMLTRLICRYEIARFPDVAVALALVSVQLESFTCDRGKWICITGKLQQLTKVSTGDLMTCRRLLLRYLPSRNKVLSVEKPVLLNRAFLATQPHIEATQTANKQETLHVNNVAMKRKATSSSTSKRNDHSKKPHPEELRSKDAVVDVAEANRASDSNSDGSNDEEPQSIFSRRLTYAEIVKYGQEGKLIDSDTATSCISDMSKRCSFEANCALMSALSPGHNVQRGIKI